MSLCFDYRAVRRFLEDACANYEKSAPALADWLDEMYMALESEPKSVTVYELLQLQQLQLNGEWEHPNYAQNRWYKVREVFGKERGVLSY